MEIVSENQQQRCPICMTSREEAINRQVKDMSCCGHNDCPFKEAITEAINYKREHPFTVREIKPKIKIKQINETT